MYVTILFFNLIRMEENCKKIKMSWKGYWKPTPKGIRKLADSILAGATLASTFTFIMDHKEAAIIIMVISVMTKILSNFLSDESENI